MSYPFTSRTEALEAYIKEIAQIAQEKGWYDKPRSIPEDLCLIHSELSELLEEYRGGAARDFYFSNKYTSGGTNNETEIPKPEGLAVELADVIIRALDMAYRHGLDLPHALEEKIKYNRTRPYRHGGKIL